MDTLSTESKIAGTRNLPFPGKKKPMWGGKWGAPQQKGMGASLDDRPVPSGCHGVEKGGWKIARGARIKKKEETPHSSGHYFFAAWIKKEPNSKREKKNSGT